MALSSTTQNPARPALSLFKSLRFFFFYQHPALLSSAPSPSPMRGLNLSRLAARGRAAEGSFFKDVQAEQATKLRATLSAEELASAKSSQSATPSVDTLSEISAQSAYRTLLKRPPPSPAPAQPRPLLSRLASLDPAKYAGLSRRARPSSTPADPEILRGLGSAKLNMLNSLATQRTAPLPGSERYADGAVLGMASFSVATAIVGSIGLMGGLYVYFNPLVVDRMRQRSVRFAGTIDRSLGNRLRQFSDNMRSRGPILSDDVGRRAREIATSAVKLPASERDHDVQRDRSSATEHREPTS